MKKYLIILFALFIAAGCSNNDSSDSKPATVTILDDISFKIKQQ